jgi:hypothetical protein
MLLERDAVPRMELPLPLSPDLDPLYLTGIVEMVADEKYRLQNLIYRQFLQHHLTPGRVGHVLTMVGRWDSAIGYLESTIHQGDRQSRTDILPATINSIYASQYLAEAVSFLQRGMAAAYGIKEVQVWYALPQEDTLRLIGQPGQEVGEFWNDMDIPTTADRIEARAFRQEIPLRGQEDEHHTLRAIPLKIPGRKPVGVVTLYDDPEEEIHFSEQRERELQLIGFLTRRRAPCWQSRCDARSWCWPAGYRPVWCHLQHRACPAGRSPLPGDQPAKRPAIFMTLFPFPTVAWES